MNCRQIRNFYLKQARQESAAPASITEHVQHCPVCQEFCSALSNMDSLLAVDHNGADQPEDLHADIMMAVERERQNQPTKRANSVSSASQSMWLALSMGAAACCMALCVWWMLNSPPPSSSSPVTGQQHAAPPIKKEAVEPSKSLAALTQSDVGDEVYQQEVDGLLNFIGANAQLLFSRHEVMKKGGR